jgi:hypothetical protein
MKLFYRLMIYQISYCYTFSVLCSSNFTDWNGYLWSFYIDCLSSFQTWQSNGFKFKEFGGHIKDSKKLSLSTSKTFRLAVTAIYICVVLPFKMENIFLFNKSTEMNTYFWTHALRYMFCIALICFSLWNR